MIEAINSMLEPLDLNVKKGVDEDDRSNYFILVNTSNRVPTVVLLYTKAKTKVPFQDPWRQKLEPYHSHAHPLPTGGARASSGH